MYWVICIHYLYITTASLNNSTVFLFISASSPVMIKPPQNLTALDGKDATIACAAQGAPAPNITWFVNGKNKINYPIICRLVYIQYQNFVLSTHMSL